MPYPQQGSQLSLDKRQQDQIYQLIQALAAAGHAEFRPGHIADALRESGEPMGTWQIRAVLTGLEAAGLITHDAQQNQWSLVDGLNQAASG